MEKPTPQTPAAPRGGRKLRNDLIFITALLLAVSALGLGFFLLRGEGDTVVVEIDRTLYGEYSLSEDRRVEIRTGENGEHLNVLVIENGEARMETATCPDGICAAHRPISRDGEAIVCAPHRVVVTVKTKGGKAPDIVA